MGHQRRCVAPAGRHAHQPAPCIDRPRATRLLADIDRVGTLEIRSYGRSRLLRPRRSGIRASEPAEKLFSAGARLQLPVRGGFGENIAYGYASAQSVMNGWLTSPGHRANIERASYNAIGVGVVRDSGGRLWWTQNFGSGIDGGDSPPPSPPPDPNPPPVVQPPPPVVQPAPPPPGSPPPTGDPAGAVQPRPQPSGGPAENNVVTSSKLAVSGFQVRAAKIRAGKRFRARMVVRRAPGAPVRRKMAVRCPAVVTGDRTVKVVRTKLRSLGSGRIRATCVWRVPKKSVGTKLAAQVVVVARGDSVRIAFAGRVRRA